tara:strand:+ start:1266 stop:2141 length:876 start_codon:yes stop_codon:yes gene_type:complete
VANKIISFYKFIKLKNLPKIKEQIFEKSLKTKLKGTILLAEEGINGMISGTFESIKTFEEFLGTFQEFNDLEYKTSYYDKTPFRRMLVKVKKEIITMRRCVSPQKETGQYLQPKDLKKWFDDRKDMTILDTRNTYEVAAGTFEGALDPKIESFEGFARFIDKNAEKLKSNKPIVTFCTGGIRCEKATAYMLQKGIKNVYQVEGGILKYLEETKGEEKNHWRGECVVFDKRKAVDKNLEPTEKLLCYICLLEFSKDDYKYENLGPGGRFCESCYKKLKKKSVHYTRRIVPTG